MLEAPMTTSSPDTSGEWRHEESMGPWPEAGHVCLECWQRWPCDATKLKVALDAATQRAEKAEAALDKIIAAYEATTLEHDSYYESFIEVIVGVRYERWLRERDARAALLPTDNTDMGSPTHDRNEGAATT
jgi:hypothetical protein